MAKHVHTAQGKLHFTGLRKRTLLVRLANRLLRYFKLEVSSNVGQLIDKFSTLSNEDLAATVQAILEDRIADIVSFWVEKIGVVVVAGGIFANVKFNQRIGELDCVESSIRVS